jgi:hypothetical protein
MATKTGPQPKKGAVLDDEYMLYTYSERWPPLMRCDVHLRAM